VYLGHHFPSDVAVGAGIGAAIGGVIAWGLKSLRLEAGLGPISPPSQAK